MRIETEYDNYGNNDLLQNSLKSLETLTSVAGQSSFQLARLEPSYPSI